MTKKRLEVAAAIILRAGRILVCSRPRGSALAEFWEFPGGKAEPGETLREALIREIREELALEIVPRESFWRLDHDYPDKSVRVTFFFADPADPMAEPVARDDQEMSWVTPDELGSVRFLPADLPVACALRYHLKKKDTAWQ